MAQKVINGSDWLRDANDNFDELYASNLKRGTHTVSAGEATANTVDIDSGLATGASAIVQILRSGAVATSDAAVSVAAGVLTVADGATYNLTAGDVINWIVF